MKRFLFPITTGFGGWFALLFVYACAAIAEPGLRMNEIQVIGTHNSYHVAPEEEFRQVVLKVWPEAHEWNYTHPPLDVQLENGVRSFELDLFNFEKGYRVMHAPHYDPESNCPQFKQCLETVVAWSDAHPGHVPISFLLEVKEKTHGLVLPPLPPLRKKEIERIDEEIRAVVSEEKLLTPDDVRGDAETLAEAVTERGWPLLDDVRGKMFFVLHESGAMRDWYTEGRPSLEGRAMFVRSQAGRPDAAVLIYDNPYTDRIPKHVEQGYIVRTRADAGLWQGKRGETDRRDTALASGAHIVSTDFPPGEQYEDTGYVVRFPDQNAARCNPVNAPRGCTAADLDPYPAAPTGHTEASAR